MWIVNPTFPKNRSRLYVLLVFVLINTSGISEGFSSTGRVDILGSLFLRSGSLGKCFFVQGARSFDGMFVKLSLINHSLSLYLLAQKTRGKWTLWATGTGKAKEPYNGWSDGWDSETSRRAGNSKDRSSGIQLLLLEIYITKTRYSPALFRFEYILRSLEQPMNCMTVERVWMRPATVKCNMWRSLTRGCGEFFLWQQITIWLQFSTGWIRFITWQRRK